MALHYLNAVAVTAAAAAAALIIQLITLEKKLKLFAGSWMHVYQTIQESDYFLVAAADPFHDGNFPVFITRLHAQTRLTI